MKHLKIFSSGSGASCIYSLLATRLHPNWIMMTHDTDFRSLDFAQENVTRNQLENSIQIRHNSTPFLLPFSLFLNSCPPHEFHQTQESSISSIPSTSSPLSPLTLPPLFISFVMTNPPFYESEEELTRNRINKDKAPSGSGIGSFSEMITSGGEIGFVTRLIQESIIWGSTVGWYTSMIGSKRNWKILQGDLERQSNIGKVIAKMFTQGQTTRYMLAWRVHTKKNSSASSTFSTSSSSTMLHSKKKSPPPL